MAEQLRVTYKKPGQEPAVYTAPRPEKRLRHDEASKNDGKIVADGILALVPGTEYPLHSNHGISVEIIDPEKNAKPQQLFHWDKKAKKPFEKQVNALKKRSSD